MHVEWGWLKGADWENDNVIILCFQENTDIHYKEGLIGVAMPMKGSGELYDKILQEWKDMGETKPLNVSVT